MTPIELTINQLLGKPSPKVELTLLMGDQIRKWREEESTREAGVPNKQPASNHGR